MTAHRISICVYGRDPKELEVDLGAELKKDKLEATFVAGNLDTDSVDLIPHDVLLVYVGKLNAANMRRAVAFLRAVVRRHGAWAYLSIVAVGHNRKQKISWLQLFRLGLSSVGKSEAASDVAKQITRSVRATWWYGERDGTLPVMIVHANGTIVRANSAAEQLFGPGIVSQPYLGTIEWQTGPDATLPLDHPIPVALKERSATVGHKSLIRPAPATTPPVEPIEFPGYLLVHPIMVPDEEPAHAAVWVQDQSRQKTISDVVVRMYAAAKPLLGEPPWKVEWRERVHNEIVTLATELGFTRARLYRYVPQDRRFYGKAEKGYDEPTRNNFLRGPNNKGLELNLDKPPANHSDPSGYFVLHSHQTPFLVMPRRPAFKVEGLTYEFVGEPADTTDLVKKDVAKWIDAPIWLPASGPDQPAVLWGKLSLDRGPASDSLTVHDVRDVEVFTRVVAAALAGLDVLHDKWRTLEHIRVCGGMVIQCLTGNLEPLQKVNSRVKGAVHRERGLGVYDTVIAKIVDLYLEAAGGDLALFREVNEHRPTTLRRTGPVLYLDPADAERFHVPRDWANTTGYFSTIDHPPPRVMPDPTKTPRAYADDNPGLSDKEKAYLRAIQSELHVPVYDGDKVIGFVVVVAWKPDVFKHLRPQVTDLIHVASLWLDLARRHTSGEWVTKTLNLAIAQLPKLDIIDLEDDTVWFAGLAAILTAHTGLNWNRALFFGQVASGHSHTAELKYALGGLMAGPDEVRAHEALQDAVAAGSEYRADLATLVNDRIRDPRPHYTSADGTVHQDLLYCTLCKKTQELTADERQLLTVDYWQILPTPDERTHPIHAVLRRRDATQDAPLRIDLTEPSEGWVRQMNRNFPGVFGDDGEAFVFPLWSPLVPHSPLGAILLQMRSSTVHRASYLLDVTRPFLRLVADILAVRHFRLHWQGWMENLLLALHRNEGGLKDAIGKVQTETINFLTNLCGPPTPRSATDDSNAELDNPIGKVFREDAEKARDAVTNLDGVIKTIVSEPTRRRFCDIREGVLNLPGIVRDRDDCHTLREQIEVDHSENKIPPISLLLPELPAGPILIPCPAKIFQSAITALIQNTRDAYTQPGYERRQPTVELELRTLEPPEKLKTLASIVELCYEDYGPGLPVDEPYWHLLFLKGSSSADDSSDNPRGKGLALAKAQLVAYHGDIRAERPVRGKGSRFVITFGVPKDFSKPETVP